MTHVDIIKTNGECLLSSTKEAMSRANGATDCYWKSGLHVRGKFYELVRDGIVLDAPEEDWDQMLRIFFKRYPEFKGREFFTFNGHVAIVEHPPFPSDHLELYSGDDHISTITVTE